MWWQQRVVSLKKIRWLVINGFCFIQHCVLACLALVFCESPQSISHLPSGLWWLPRVQSANSLAHDMWPDVHTFFTMSLRGFDSPGQPGWQDEWTSSTLIPLPLRLTAMLWRPCSSHTHKHVLRLHVTMATQVLPSLFELSMRLYFPSCTSPGQKGKGRVTGRKQPLLCRVVLWPALCGKHHDSNIIVITTNVLASHRTHSSAAPPSNCWCDEVPNHLSIIFSWKHGHFCSIISTNIFSVIVPYNKNNSRV